jgi:hypothetical protein
MMVLTAGFGYKKIKRVGFVSLRRGRGGKVSR